MPDKTFKIKPGYVVREVADEFLAIPFAPELNSSSIVILNPVSGLLWEMLENECALTQLIEAVTGSFSVDEATAKSDIEEFLQMLEKSDLLQ